MSIFKQETTKPGTRLSDFLGSWFPASQFNDSQGADFSVTIRAHSSCLTHIMPRRIFSAALDFGATSGRVILGEWSANRLTLTEVHRFPNSFRTLAGHDYWDPGTLWHEALTGLRRAAAALPRGATLA